jgi:hypothetical protein
MNTGKVLVPDEKTPQTNIYELPPQQIISLVKIQKPEDIKTVSDVIYWEDDRTICVGALINGIEVAWWWQGPELLGHLMYSNVTLEAKKEVFDSLKDLIDRTAEQEENVAKIVDEVEQNQQIKKNVGPEISSHFNDIIDNIL